MKLLVIRPQPGADATARRALAAGFEPVVIPFFEVRARHWEIAEPRRFDALLVSSANGIRHAGAGLDKIRMLPVHAVGSNSADAASQAGLRLASTGAEGVTAALANAAAAGHHRLLWLAGEDRTELHLPSGIEVDTAIVYASEPAEIAANALAAIANCAWVALHSARAAQAFAAYVDRNDLDRRSFSLAAFSAPIAVAAGSGWDGIAVADAPNDAALLSAVKAIVTEEPG